MGTAFQRRSVLGIADQPELPPYSSAPPSAKPQQRRGLFGRLGNMLSRVDWERVSAAMRDDPSHMQMLLSQRENMAERARQEAEAEAERRAGKGRNEQLRGFIDTLPEDQRSMAWLAPGEFVRNRIESMAGPEFGDLERIEGRLGQRNMRSGEYEWAPQVPAGANGGLGAPPSGYRWTADGNMEAVPGGPADLRATAEGRGRADRLAASESQLDRAIGAVERALPLVNRFNTGVVLGGALRDWNQGATDLNEALEPVRAILSFETLAEMRRNSETGGALGSIAVRELTLLGSVYESLSTAQSEQAMRSALERLGPQLIRARDAVRAARAEAAGAAPAGPQGGPPTAAPDDPLGIRTPR